MPMPRFAFGLAAFGLALGLVCCSAFGSADDATSPGGDSTEGQAEASADGGGRQDATDDSTSPISGDASTDGPVRCPSDKPGPKLVYVAGACIDETEVTNAQYEEYWAQRSADEPRVNACSGVAAESGTGNNTCFSGQNANYAVACVGWCDASAYCAWAGKRLCRGLGNKPLNWQDRDTQADEWMVACTNGGTQQYATGATWDPNAGCQTMDAKNAGPVPVDQGCTAPSGVHHLAGNVAEWLDICETTSSDDGASASCALGGESFTLRPNGVLAGQCTAMGQYVRTTTRPDVGFRCCADPLY